MGIASNELRVKAVSAYKTGKFSQQKLAEAYGIHYKTLQNWLRADANGEPQIPKTRGHRARVFDENEEIEVIKVISTNPSITLREIRELFNKTCNLSVIHRMLLRFDFSYKKNTKSFGARQRRCKKGTRRVDTMECFMQS
jgi:transposase